MTAAERLKLHQLILLTLRTVGEMGRSEQFLLNDIRSELDPRFSLDQLLVELRLLTDRQYVASITKQLAGVRWIITSRGEQALAEAGL